MLYQTLAQPKLLLIFLIVGFVCGLVFDIGNIIKFLCANKKFPSVVIDTLQTSICLFILFVVNLKINYGELRIFPALIFVFSFLIERRTLGKIIAKVYFSCYNMINKRI